MIGYINNFKPENLHENIYKDLMSERIIYYNDDISDATIDIVAMPILIMNELEKDIPEDKLKPKGYSTFKIRFLTIVVEFEFISILKFVS